MAVTQLHCGSVHYRVGCETSPTRSSGDRTRVDWGHLSDDDQRPNLPSSRHAHLRNASATQNVGLRIFDLSSRIRTRRMAGALLRSRTRSSFGRTDLGPASCGSRARRLLSSSSRFCQDGSVVAPWPRSRNFMKKSWTGH